MEAGLLLGHVSGTILGSTLLDTGGRPRGRLEQGLCPKGPFDSGGEKSRQMGRQELSLSGLAKSAQIQTWVRLGCVVCKPAEFIGVVFGEFQGGGGGI